MESDYTQLYQSNIDIDDYDDGDHNDDNKDDNITMY